MTDPGVWERALRSVAESCVEAGFEVLGVASSPLLGPAGNVEFLLHARRDTGRPGEPEGSSERMIRLAVEEGGRIRGEGRGGSRAKSGGGEDG